MKNLEARNTELTIKVSQLAKELEAVKGLLRRPRSQSGRSARSFQDKLLCGDKVTAKNDRRFIPRGEMGIVTRMEPDAIDDSKMMVCVENSKGRTKWYDTNDLEVIIDD